MEVTLDEKRVMYISAQNTQDGPNQAFEELESHFPSLRGRKFYGTLQNGEYRACVEINSEDNIVALGLNTDLIPGGLYVREKIKDWTNKISVIEKTFDLLSKSYESDTERPNIEFYKSQKELILYFPIKG